MSSLHVIRNITTAPAVKLDIKVTQFCEIKVAVICCLTAPPFSKSAHPPRFAFSVWVLFLFFFCQIKQSYFLSLVVKITTILVWILSDTDLTSEGTTYHFFFHMYLRQLHLPVGYIYAWILWKVWVLAVLPLKTRCIYIVLLFWQQHKACELFPLPCLINNTVI